MMTVVSTLSELLDGLDGLKTILDCLPVDRTVLVHGSITYVSASIQQILEKIKKDKAEGPHLARTRMPAGGLAGVGLELGRRNRGGGGEDECMSWEPSRSR